MHEIFKRLSHFLFSYIYSRIISGFLMSCKLAKAIRGSYFILAKKSLNINIRTKSERGNF